VKIQNFLHKGLRRLYEDDNCKGVPADALAKLRSMFLFMDNMENALELRTLPTWKAHTLTGDRQGTWSLHVTRNWRLTFIVDTEESILGDVNLEDYH
jgi:proteic killer suppression protein